jgi:hypothetical protein
MVEAIFKQVFECISNVNRIKLHNLMDERILYMLFLFKTHVIKGLRQGNNPTYLDLAKYQTHVTYYKLRQSTYVYDEITNPISLGSIMCCA